MRGALFIAIRSPKYQYGLGLLLNCLCLIILFSHDTSYRNLQLPEGIYADNLWKGGDVGTYVTPARHFVQDGTFVSAGTSPDYHRTIGYPFFLSVFMLLFSDHWLVVVLFAQAALFALMYPLLSRIATHLFDAADGVVVGLFIFLLLSGAYIVRVPALMTDTFFTVLFTLGVWAGLEAVSRHDYKLWALHVIGIGYAAQVRPTLFLYPVLDYFLLRHVSAANAGTDVVGVRRAITISFVMLMLVCNLPSMRNYGNHGFFKPSDVLSANLFDDLGRYVLAGLGKVDEFNAMQNTIQASTDVRERMRLQQEMGLAIYSEYPVATLKELARNATGILGRAHWPVIAHFWGYSFMNNADPAHMPLKEWRPVTYLERCFNLLYLFVYLFAFLFLVRASRSGEFKFAVLMCLLLGYLLIPTFVTRGAGSRLRLPVEGFVAIMAVCECAKRFEAVAALQRSRRVTAR